ncbi:MAG: hypothetical protein RIC55_31175 [Pirellulaceae bacterium]
MFDQKGVDVDVILNAFDWDTVDVTLARTRFDARQASPMDVQEYLTARRWRPRFPPWLNWPRPRARFSLAILLAGVTVCCAVLAYWRGSREYPRLTFERYYKEWDGRRVLVERIRLRFHADKVGESYQDYEPWGTLNTASVPVAPFGNQSLGNFDEMYDPPMVGHWPPIPEGVQQRYLQLRREVTRRIDTTAVGPANGTVDTWVLPEDFPTFEQFMSEHEDAGEEGRKMRPLVSTEGESIAPSTNGREVESSVP